MMNILTQNAGIVRKGKKLFLEVSVTNTNQKDFIGIYKLKIQINVPTKIVSIDSLGCILPTGWKILSYDGDSVILSNGLDMISATDRRNLLIAVKGKNIGGPSTISGQLSFSNGIAPGTEVGSLKNDLDGDNYSTTTCTVLK
ncbi:MAG: hypothetical protein ACKVOM_00185 [Ferruginibacter sp.]